MEWVKVVYPSTRDVFVDDRRSGQTNVVLAVAKGTHRFYLGTPRDYAPQRRDVKVTDSSPLDPREIEFELGATAPV